MRAVKEIERKYYKYIDVPFNQPTLSSNGTVGGDHFAVYCNLGSDPWKAFDKNTSTYWGHYDVDSGAERQVTFYNPKLLKVTNIRAQFNPSSGDDGYIHPINRVYASKDGSSWVTIADIGYKSNAQAYDLPCTDNNEFYNYYRVGISTSGGWYHDSLNVQELTITAEERTIGSGTEHDYDFYKDIQIYKLPKLENKYYAINQ